MKAVTEHFYRWGWLAPALLPVTQLGGRALFTVVVWLYFFWGCAVFIREKVQLDKRYLLLFGALIVSYSLSIPLAEDSMRAFRKWTGYASMASVFVFTWMVLEVKGIEAARKLVKWIAIFGLLMLGGAYLQMFIRLGSETLIHNIHLKEDSMPYLMPFVFLFLYRLEARGLCWVALIAAAIAFIYYIFLSQGRAAQLAAALNIFVLLFVGLRIRWYLAAFGACLVLAGIAAGNWSTFYQLSGNEQNLYDLLNKFTSYRWVIWDHALEHSPDNHFFGYGMGNIRFIEEVVRYSDTSSVGHLHNFILDVWFETGWLGLVSLFSMLTFTLCRGAKVLVSLDSEQRLLAGAAFAAVAAILVAGLFSFSYASKQFGAYMMLCLAILAWLACQHDRTVAKDSD